VFQRLASSGSWRQRKAGKPDDESDCLNKYIKYPFKQPTDWQAVFESNNQPKSNNESGLPDFARYKLIGQMENQQVLMSYSANYGGSGTFSHAFLVQGISLEKQVPNKKTLTQTLAIEGGDRCFGSIEKLSIISPSHFEVRRKLTPAALVSFGKEAQYSLKINKGLSDCALCCIGSYVEKIDTTGEKN
jgi:hypothetical protein